MTAAAVGFRLSQAQRADYRRGKAAKTEREAAVDSRCQYQFGFETAHIPGAKWISRGWIDIKLPELIVRSRTADCC